MLECLQNWLHTTTINKHSSNQRLENITKNLAWFKKFNITLVQRKVFIKTVQYVFVNFSFHAFLLFFLSFFPINFHYKGFGLRLYLLIKQNKLMKPTKNN